MNIAEHLIPEKIKSWKASGGPIIFLGIAILMGAWGASDLRPSFWGFVFSCPALLFLWCGIDARRTVARFEKEIAVLQQHPEYTFTQIGAALQLKPQTVRADFSMAIRQKALVGVALVAGQDVLVCVVPPPTPIVKSKQESNLVSVICPHCGANCTISSVSGGQCEYCGSFLSSDE